MARRFHDYVKDNDEWQTLEENQVFSNPFVEVAIVKVKTPSRPEGAIWTQVHRKGSCVVAPITADGKLLLVRQERIPIRASIWEFPAGQVDVAAEHDDAILRETALRELREESGHQLAEGGELIPLGPFFSSAGIMDEHAHLFVARPVVPTGKGRELDDNEAITECRAFTPEEFRQMIASSEIRDANTLSTFARMVALGIL